MIQPVEFLISGVKDSSGNAVASGKAYFYQAGTTTLATVYQDNEKTNAHPNPLTLDANGAAVVYIEDRVKIYIETSAGAEVTTIDNIGIGSSDVTGDLGSNVSRLNLVGLDVQSSAASGSFQTTSSSFVDVTNLVVTVETDSSNRPVFIFTQPTEDLGYFGGAAAVANASLDVEVQVVRGASTVINAQWIGINMNSATMDNFKMPAALLFVDFEPLPSQQAEYKLQVRAPNSITAQVINVQLFGYQTL